MRHTRRSQFALGGGLATTLLAACGGAMATPGRAPAGEKAPVSLAIAAGDWVSPEDKELHRTVWSAFQQSRPHVTLDVNEIAFSTDKLLTSVAGGTAPDAAYIHPNDLPSVAAPGAYQDLDKLIRADRSIDLKVFFPKVLEFFRIKGTNREWKLITGGQKTEASSCSASPMAPSARAPSPTSCVIRGWPPAGD